MDYIKNLFINYFFRVILTILITYLLSTLIYEIINKIKGWNDKKIHLFYKIASAYLLITGGAVLLEAAFTENLFFIIFSLLVLYGSYSLSQIAGFAEATVMIIEKVKEESSK